MMSQRREQKHLLEVGKTFIEDDSIPVPKRIKNLRIFLRTFHKEKEKLKMAQFKQINGFAADDDDAKRALVDQLVYEIFNRYPKDDEERNRYTHSRENYMMRIGWKPSA
jgi:hypothetical protein